MLNYAALILPSPFVCQTKQRLNTNVKENCEKKGRARGFHEPDGLVMEMDATVGNSFLCLYQLFIWFVFSETGISINRYLNTGYFQFQGKKRVCLVFPLPPFNRAIKKTGKRTQAHGDAEAYRFPPPPIFPRNTHSSTSIPQNPFTAHEKNAFPVAAKSVGLPC